MAQSILEESKKAKHGFFRFFFKKRNIIILVILLAIAGGAYYYFTKNNSSKSTAIQLKQYTVKKQDLKIAVSSTGKVVAKDGVQLSFPISGNLEVSAVYVKEGDKIKKGDKIAAVKTESLAFDLRSANNTYQSALASYNSKVAAPTDAAKKSAQTSIDQAQVSLDQAKISLAQTQSTSAQSIANAQNNVTTAESNLRLNSSVSNSAIVNNAYLSLINNLKSIDVSLAKILRDSDSIVGVDNTNINIGFRSGLGVLDASSFNNAKTSYSTAKTQQQQFDSVVTALSDSSSQSSLDNAAIQATQVVTAMQNHLQDMQRLLDASITFSGLPQSQLDGFKAMVNSDQSAVISMMSSLNNSTQSVDDAKNSLSQYQTAYTKAQNDLKTAQSQADQNIKNSTISVQSREISLTQAKNDYTTLMTSPSQTDLASYRTQITSAAIGVDRANYNMTQATLVSPIDGVVSMLNYKQGDIILDTSTDKTVATILNSDTLYIEVNVEEADISKLKVGDKAAVTFDALDGVNLTGEISFISLTSTTNSNGIVTYLVRVLLPDASKDQVREGMTASLDFITAEAPNVLAVPVQAVRNIGGKPSVIMLDNSVRNVVTDFTDGQSVEIVSGLNAGEVIVY